MRKSIYTAVLLVAICSSCGSGNKSKNQEQLATDAPSSSVTESSRRTVGAPTSAQDLRTNFTGTFTGVLPCADCPGIETQLTLNADYSYVLTTVYQGKGNGKSFEQKGKWTPSEDLAIIELDYDKPSEHSYFLLVDKNTLEQLDRTGEPITSKANLRLIR